MKDVIKERVSSADSDALVDILKQMARLSVEAHEIADDCNLTRREIATRMGNASPSTLQRLLAGAAYNATFDTLARFAWACGYELKASFVRRGEEARLPARAGSARPSGGDLYDLSSFKHLYAGGRGWPAPANNSDFEPQLCVRPALRAGGGHG